MAGSVLITVGSQISIHILRLGICLKWRTFVVGNEFAKNTLWCRALCCGVVCMLSHFLLFSVPSQLLFKWVLLPTSQTVMFVKTILCLNLVLATLLLCACSSNEVFSERKDIETLNWDRLDVLTFSTTLADAKPHYRVKAVVRYASQCPIGKLPLMIKYKVGTAPEQTVNSFITIKDGDGNNTGEGLGDLWDTETVVIDDITIPAPNTPFTCAISHNDIKPKAPLVMKVGCVVEKK